jgi:hypothetical protein
LSELREDPDDATGWVSLEVLDHTGVPYAGLEITMVHGDGRRDRCGERLDPDRVAHGAQPRAAARPQAYTSAIELLSQHEAALRVDAARDPVWVR